MYNMCTACNRLYTYLEKRAEVVDVSNEVKKKRLSAASNYSVSYLSPGSNKEDATLTEK